MGKGKPEPHILEEAKSIKEKIQMLEPDYEKTEAEFLAIYKRIPNIATADTPVGLTEEENVIVKQWGKIREFDFPVKNHAEIAALRGWIDKERAANVAGSRFAYLMGDLVKLQFALIQWTMDKLAAHGFVPVITPVLVREEMMELAGFFPTDRSQVYELEADGLYLIGTAEVGLAGLHRGERLVGDDLPLRYVG